MLTTTHNFNITFDPIGPSNVKCGQYTLPTFCEAYQGNVLINPATGRRLGSAFPYGENLATSSPLPAIDWRPDTGTQLTGRSSELAWRLRAVLDNLERIAALPENWDTFGSGRASVAALNSSRDLIWKALIQSAAQGGSDSTPYDVAPLSGGGLQIEWRGGGGNIEVEVSSEGRYGYLLSREWDGRIETEEADDAPSERILYLISTIFQ